MLNFGGQEQVFGQTSLNAVTDAKTAELVVLAEALGNRARRGGKGSGTAD